MAKLFPLFTSSHLPTTILHSNSSLNYLPFLMLCVVVWGDLGKTLDRSCPMGPCIVVAEGTYVCTIQ